MPKLNHCSIDQVYLVAKSIPVKWITSIVLSHFEGPDSPPKNFTAFAISSRSAHLSWLPPPREHRNGLIRHFWINITEINTGRKFERTLFSTATVLSSLHPYYTYQFSVAAYTVSLGPFTTAFVLKMPQDGETVCYLKQYVGHINYG